MKTFHAMSFFVISLVVLSLGYSPLFFFKNHVSLLTAEEYDNCYAGIGWRWVNGSDQPITAQLIKETLELNEILSRVDAVSFGEMDTCNNYIPRGIDIHIMLLDYATLGISDKKELEEKIYAALLTIPEENIGNVKISYPKGEVSILHLNKLVQDKLSSINMLGEYSWKKITTPKAPSQRMVHGMAYDRSRNKVILFGGDDTGFSRLNDTWEYDGIDWVRKYPDHLPPGRANIDQGMVFDTWRNKIVVFGGLGIDRYLNDTWEYDGTDWKIVLTTQKPSSRDAHAMAFDHKRGKTVLFGGYVYGETNDTWEYDGDWHLLSPTINPPARSHHSMVYDAKRGVVVLFGGGNSTGVLNDTWEFDGTSWRKVNPIVSPSVRQNHSMTYDAARGLVVLFGGVSGNKILDDTWEYDGTTWREVHAFLTPLPRTETNLVFDVSRRKVVMFGGGSSSEGFPANNETWEYPFSDSVSESVFKKKVYVIAYNPFIDQERTTRLWDYLHWNSYEAITDGTIDFFLRNSSGELRYEVVETTVIDELPQLEDGYTYTIPEYLDIINGIRPPHSPIMVDYNHIVNDARLDICGKANRHEIDEVWIYNGPAYGFWESTLVGPGAYWYNSEPVPGPYSCNRIVPIMGPNPERWIPEAIENFGHRMESTMGKVYNYEWDQNQTDSNLEKFILVDAQSPNYNYSGCGSIHYPPNGQSDYDWSNLIYAKTYCDDFNNYPYLKDPIDVLRNVNCSEWGCDGLGYFSWWYLHLPKNTGCGPDKVANNWWVYLANPELAINPLQGCSINSPNHYFVPLIVR